MKVAVIVPTVKGREEHLDRCLAAYRDTPDVHLYIERAHPSCGSAWLAGAKRAAHDGFDYLHLTADDLEPHDGWLEPAVGCVDGGNLPAPLVFFPEGALQSAGIRGWDCYHGPYEDGMAVDSTTVPFMSRDMWNRIGMVAIHYCSDLWVSHMGSLNGWPTVLRTGYAFTHHNAPRDDQDGRTVRDRAEYERLTAAAA